MQVSVVMAVYNRASLLPDLLEHWKIVDKATKYEYELIFSDDASSDDSVAILNACKGLPIRVLRNNHGGAAKARNHAYQYATGEIIIFTGDDIFPEPNFVNEHYETYLKNGEMYATLGRIDWRKGIQMNHLMTHITDIGCEQFGFVGMKPFEIVDFRHFYTSNISVARKKLVELEYLFNNEFKKANFEDIELGYRLYKNGVQIYYNPNIVVYHDHVYSSVDKYCRRQLTAGEELNTFKRIQPSLSREEIKVDIESFNEQYARYVEANKIVDVVADSGRIMIYILKQLTKLLEKVLKKVDLYSIRMLCSRFYSIVFSYYMYLGLALGYDEVQSSRKFLAERFVFRYLFYGKSQIFYDSDNHFNEYNSVTMSTSGEKDLTLQLNMQNKPVGRIRFDPLDHNCKIKLMNAYAVLKDDSRVKISFEFTNANSVDNNVYDFSSEVDPILISEFLPKETQSIEIRYSINYLLARRLWKVTRSALKLFIKAVKKLFKLLFQKRKKEISIQVVEDKKNRKICVSISGTSSNEDISSLIQEYQKYCSYMSNVKIQSSSLIPSGYDGYIYEVSSIHNALEKAQFLNAILCILHYDYDFVIVSDKLEYFPLLYGHSVQDSTIYAHELAPFDSFHKESTGKFLRIPGSKQIDKIIELDKKLPFLSSGENGIIYMEDIRKISWFQDTDYVCKTKSKPIVFVFPVFMAVGGVERNTIEIMKRLKEDYDFVVITFEPHRPEQGSLHYQITELCVTYLELSEITTFDKYLILLDEIKGVYDPDLVWICNSSPWLMENTGEIRRVFYDVPVIVQDVYDDQYGWIEYYDRPAIHSYDRFIAINKKIEDKFINTYGINPQNIDLVYSAINVDVIRETVENFEREKVLKTYHLDPNKQHFAFIGRLAEQKQPHKVFELAKYIVETYDHIDFVMVGDGELFSSVELLIENNRLKDRIHRLKYVANSPELIKAMDGLVIASIFEGLPIVTIEAMCVGTPIISTDVGDIAIFVNEYDIGVVSKDQHIKSLKLAFDTFYQNIDFYKNNSILSEERYMEFFSAKRAANLMHESFSKAMAKYPEKIEDGGKYVQFNS